MSADAVVTSLRAAAYTVPTDLPEGDGTLTWDSTTLVLVEAGAAGCTGLGWTYGPRAGVAVVEELLAPVVIGAEALDVEAAWEAMVRAVRNAGRPGLVGMALSAVDIALWDLSARLHDRPLADLWAGPAQPVEVYGSGGFTTYDDHQLRAQLDGWVSAGLDKVKIKIGESWGARVERDLDRVGTARRTVGDAVALFVDANGGYAVKQAGIVGHFLDAVGVSWFEEPVSSDDHEGLASVKEKVRADVTAGEYGYDRSYFTRLAPYVDCLQVDVTRCGGYTEWRRIAADASAAGRELSGHCAPYVSLPVASLTPALRHLEFFHDHVRIEQAFFDGADPPIDGCLRVPDGPGHGLTFRARDAEEYRVG